ncbi:condensation domain-containing protein [Streptomyces sp. T028]|uniref:condensation domain-containing protein n=1 Tax=Streptomyces sp. T028 TaxID=3394379 RepID=UPI003A84799D
MYEANGTAEVKFSGARGGRATTTWAQRDTWLTLEANRPHTARFQVPLLVEVPAGRGLGDVLDVVSRLVERHEGLRTVFTRVSDDGPPDQEVVRQGTLTVPVVEVDAAPALPEVTRLVEELTGMDPSAGRDRAIDFAVLTRDGAPAWLVASLSHLTVDAVAVDLLAEDGARLLTEGNGALPPPPAHQPLDRAEFEQSDQGRKILDTALRGWEQGLRAVPWSLFRTPVAPDTERRFPSVRLYSRGTGALVRETAGARGVSPSAIYVAAAAAALGRAFSVDACALVITCANRWLPRTARYMGCVAQQGLLTLPTLGSSPGDLVDEVWPRILGLHRTSMWDPYRLYRQLRPAESGARPALDQYVNVLQEKEAVVPQDVGPLEDGGFLLRHEPPVASSMLRFGLNIRTDGNDVAIRLFSDQRYVPVSMQEETVLNIHRFLSDRRR